MLYIFIAIPAVIMLLIASLIFYLCKKRKDSTLNHLKPSTSSVVDPNTSVRDLYNKDGDESDYEQQFTRPAFSPTKLPRAGLENDSTLGFYD